MDYRDQTPMSYAANSEATSYDAGLRGYMLGIYNYMCSALALTGITAYLAATWAPLTNALYVPQGNHMALTGLGMLVALAPIAFVLIMSLGINRLSVAAAQGLFWAFAAIMGLSLSSLFFAYTGTSIVRVFFITAITFGSMSMWGYTTKKDLTGMGSFLMMGVWGILIAMVVNMFLHSTGMQFLISIIGVLVFTGLTAYDTQKLKALYYQVAGNAEGMSKSSILGALNLYLDFINMFVMLMRLMGDRR